MEELLSREGYALVFEDDFDGDRLNRADWTVELHEPGWVNEEWQRYVDSEENIFLRDGKLHLQPVRKTLPDGRVSYTAGRVSTEGKHDFTCGLFEARLRVPKGKGYLPAFWLLSVDEEGWGGWPRCGEIDIMEIMGHETNKVYGTIHYGLPHEQSQGSLTLAEGDFAEDFHDFALKWEPGRLRWYVDGRFYREARSWYSSEDDGSPRPFPAPFDHDHYIILNLAVGNNWAGYPDETTSFDRAFEVDWVRVYQKKEERHETCVSR